MSTPTLPTPTVTVAGQDVTDRIDLDSLQRTMTERGEASCVFDITLSDENDVPTNALVRDAVVTVHVEGALRWYGHVVNVSQPQPGDPVITCEASGSWDLLHQKEDGCWAFVETRPELVQEYPPASYDAATGGGFTVMTALDMNTESQIQWTLPKGSKVKTGQSRVSYLWPFDGMDPDLVIGRVSGTVTCGGNDDLSLQVSVGASNPFDGAADFLAIANYLSDAGQSGSFNVTDFSALTGDPTHLRFWAYAPSDVAELSLENFVQLRDLTIYYDRTTAPTIDQAALEIWTDVTGLTDSVTETIGSALTQLMVDPFTDGADAISQVLAKATTPPMCGVIHNQFRCINRPTAPTDNTRLFVVSDQLTPGLEWEVTPDTAGSKDTVALTYTQIIASPTTTPSGLPARMYYSGGTDYSTPASNTARIALIDSGTELTDTEAAAAARQAYGYYHNFVQGTVTIPYSCHNGNGQPVSIEHIEAWDWVYNAGKANTAEAGPFLISEVSIQDGVAVLTIGATEGYNYESPYRLPTKGRYVGAHRQRTSHLLYRRWYQKELRRKWRQYLKTSKSGTRTWKTFSAYAKAHPAPKHHPKYHNTYKNVEGRYV